MPPTTSCCPRERKLEANRRSHPSGFYRAIWGDIMKSFVLAASCAAAFLVASPAGANKDLVFTLSNKTAVELRAFYASPSNVGSWEEDILGRDTLAAGETVSITIADGRSQCEYDLRSEFADGDVVEDTVNLCETESYTIE